jgi:hypothetical protein
LAVCQMLLVYHCHLRAVGFFCGTVLGPQFCSSACYLICLSGYINPLPQHLVPIALHTAYIVCQTYIHLLATGLSSLYYPICPIRQHPYTTYDQYVHGPPQVLSMAVHTLCHICKHYPRIHLTLPPYCPK